MQNWDSAYWTSRYHNNETQWDAGKITTPLKEYFDQLEDKSLAILIPGAGNAYEAEYLFDHGFEDAFVMDVSEVPLQNLKMRVPGFPTSHLIHEDFFDHEGQYDLIVEQTFFCSLDPGRREDYAKKMLELLKPGGILVGVLFDDKLNDDHPPFGGNSEDYKPHFEDRFKVLHFERSRNSIKPREGRELFIELQKPGA
ncbi:MAG: methyltransferase domain-containing protein [Cyclobacteriaceae bacterium]